MSKAASEREAQSRRIIKAMNAKGLSFKSLSAEIGLSPFTTAAALHGQRWGQSAHQPPIVDLVQRLDW